jgi:hypothetical protein
VRSSRDGPVEAVLVLGTEGAPERRRLRGGRTRAVERAEPEPVPTARASVVRPEPFGSKQEAADWLDALRNDEDGVDTELAGAVRILNRAQRARRAASADPYVAETSLDRVLVARIGYGPGEAVADGRFGEALELPRPGARRFKRSMEAPDERFAALLGAREQALVAEELVLRARCDLDAGRPREAALQARVALEALVAERPQASNALAERRSATGELANRALAGGLDERDRELLAEVVAEMEGVLRRLRLGR